MMKDACFDSRREIRFRNRGELRRKQQNTNRFDTSINPVSKRTFQPFPEMEKPIQAGG
jgi:hypothetical protein